MATLQIRLASPEDNERLLQLTRDCPVQGPISFQQERGPRFFTFNEVQGEFYRIYVAEYGQRIIGSASCVLRWTYLNGRETPTWYVGDLKIAPDMRGKGILREFVTKASDHFWGENSEAEVALSLIVKTNPASRVLPAGRPYMPLFVPLGTVRNYAVHLFCTAKSNNAFQIARATGQDIEAMTALMQKVYSRKQFGPVIEPTGFWKRVEQMPGLGIHNFYLAKQGGKLLGLVAVWDQQDFRKIKILSFSPAIRFYRGVYNLFTRLFAFHPMPSPGAHLPFFYLSHLAIDGEDPRVFHALLNGIHSDYSAGAHLFFTVALAQDSPLAGAFRGYFYHTFDMLAFAIMPPKSPWRNFDFHRQPLYVDSALT